MKNIMHFLKLASLAASLLVLSSCGGGGGSTTPATGTLGGVAAVGTPIVGGTIKVICAAGSALTATTSSTGTWQLTLSGQTLPCAVELSGGTINSVANTTSYYSIALTTGTVNVTPLTDLMMANLLKTANLSTWFAGLSTNPAPLASITQAQVNTALANLSAALPALTPLATTNPITTTFTPTSGNTSDDMLTALAVAIASNTAGVTYASLLSDASAPSFTAPAAGFSTALANAYASTASGAGTFIPLTATMTSARVLHTATLLPNGTILITGGQSAWSNTPLNTAELYDPVANTFTVLTATMTTVRAGHTATLLPNGKVLITGGSPNASGSHEVNTAEVYDPVANTFTALGATMTTARYSHMATLLPSGKVLLTGGWQNGSSIALNTAEVYDPVANTFTALTSTMISVRADHMAALLPNGKVLLAGGSTSSGGNSLNTAEVYDPTTQTFTALTSTMTTVRVAATATLLPDGKVLFTGGGGDSGILKTAEVYDPVANTFTALTVTMTTVRGGHTATLLPNGNVLLTGGTIDTSNATIPELNSAEVYAALPPSSNTFTALTSTMSSVREGLASTLLPSGKVLITGGENGAPPGHTGTTYNTAQLYDPVANTFTSLTPTMTTPREAHTSTLLPNGTVLITSGFDNQNGNGGFNTAEIYDPVANTFTALTATMVSLRCNAAASLLPNGKVLITGGSVHSGSALNTAELYDPVAQTFTAVSATMTVVRQYHTSTLLPNGTVLLAGGATGSGIPMNTAEVYDPVANTFTALNSTLTTTRGGHTATLLSNGKVLLAGGFSTSSPASNTAELYDPVADTFTALSATMTTFRALHAATRLPDGQVLLTGGLSNISTGPVLNTAELYAP